MRKSRRLRGPKALLGVQDTLRRVTAASEETEVDLAPGTDVAGIFKLKQHVDNPGQTPM